MVWDVDREIFSVGSFVLRWYSLLFALGFVGGYFIMQSMFKAAGKSLVALDSLLFHAVIGTVVGARLGHCLFYEPGDYLSDPIRILKVWEGGLASHGGFTGLIIALILFCRRYREEFAFFWLADRCSVPALMTAGFIRIGNFFNSEILGKPASVAWAVTFKKIDNIPRHPTQIYEAIGYLAISLICYLIYRGFQKKPREGLILGVVMILGYGFRAFIEIFKENQVAFEDGLPLNMGQLLSLPFLGIGLFFALGGQFRYRWLRLGLSREALAAAGIPVETERENGETPEAGEKQAKSRRGQLRRQRQKLRQ